MAGALSPRRVALDLLARIRRDKAYANMVFATAPELGALAERDRALVTRLVYGALQMEGSLDAALEHVATQGRLDAPPLVMDALRLGAYQLLFMDVPPHAAIGETVGAIDTRPAQKWRGLANAMLRALDREREGFPWVERESDLPRWLALTYGHPAWLVERLLAAYGEEETEALLAADNEPAPIHLRVNELVTSRELLMSKLASRGYRVAAGSVFPEAVIVGGPPGVWREPEAGHEFLIQDEGSLLAPRLLEPDQTDQVVDLAAGRGGKATHLAALMGNAGRVLALDVFEAKARQCSKLAEAMGATIIECRACDALEFARQVLAGQEEPFDGVLLDAPCSGTGTLRRRAELRWRRTPEEVGAIVQLQAGLLAAAATVTRERGRLVYSTCSVLPEENDEQVTRFLGSGVGRDFRLVESRQLLPSRDGTDGHYAALLVKEPR